MIQTFYVCLLAVLFFHFIFFTLVVKALRELRTGEANEGLELKVPSRI